MLKCTLTHTGNLHTPDQDALEGLSVTMQRISKVVKGDAFESLSGVQLIDLDLVLKKMSTTFFVIAFELILQLRKTLKSVVTPLSSPASRS